MCYDTNARPPMPPSDGGTARGHDIVLTAADGTRFAAYSAVPEATSPAARAIIFPDVRGLHGFYKDLAVRFAEQGVAALAIDYFGRTAGLTDRDDAFEFRSHVQQMSFDTFSVDVDAALAYHHEGVPTDLPAFTIGFCMGGALSLKTAMREAPLSGAIGFYAALSRDVGGGGTLLEQAMRIRYPVLGLFGGADSFIPQAEVDTLDRELDNAGVEHDIVVYPGAPHSFFDRQSAAYADASADAWTRVLAFIGSHASPA